MDNLVLSNIFHRPARTLVSVLGIAVGVLLVVFTVGLARGVLRERGRREGTIGAEIRVQASGVFGLSAAQTFTFPLSRAQEISRIEGVRLAVPLAQAFDATTGGFGGHV